MNEVYELLTKAQDLIRDPKNWTKGTFARSNEKIVLSTDPKANCWCSIGAIHAAGKCENPSLERQAELVLNYTVGMWIGLYNDTRNHDQVMRAWDKARELARS